MYFERVDFLSSHVACTRRQEACVRLRNSIRSASPDAGVSVLQERSPPSALFINYIISYI